MQPSATGSARSIHSTKQEWASHFREWPGGGEASDSSALAFRIGREWLALPTRVFVPVAPQVRPHVLPHRSGRGLLGIVNIGGKLYPCMSLAGLLGIAEQGAAPAQGRHTFARLLLLQWEQQAYALPVAELHGIVRYAGAAVRAPAATINKGLSRFLSGRDCRRRTAYRLPRHGADRFSTSEAITMSQDQYGDLSGFSMLELFRMEADSHTIS